MLANHGESQDVEPWGDAQLSLRIRKQGCPRKSKGIMDSMISSLNLGGIVP